MKDPECADHCRLCRRQHSAKNQGRMFITLKPHGNERKITADQVIGETAAQAGRGAGRNSLHAVRAGPDHRRPAEPGAISVHAAGREPERSELLGAAACCRNLRTLPRTARRQHRPAGQGPGSDGDHRSRYRLAAGRLRRRTLTTRLYDAFGQRQVSIIYKPAEPISRGHGSCSGIFSNSPEALQNIYVRSSNGTLVPLAAFAHFGPSNTPLAVSHQGQFPAVTISFNLAPNVSLGQATEAIDNCGARNQLSRHHPCQLSGNGSGVPGIAGQRACADPDCAGHGVHRSRHSLRELHPSHHDSFDPAFRRSGRVAGAAVDSQRAERDGTDRHHSADWHREKERDHDDRFRAGGGTARRQVSRDAIYEACISAFPAPS